MSDTGNGEYLFAPNESERQKFFLACMDELDELDLRAALLRQERKRVKERLSGNGYNIKSFDLARRLMAMSSSDMRDFYTQLGEFSEWLGKPLGYQGDLFDSSVDLTESGEMTVVWQGKMAALHGHGRDENPHQPGRSGYTLWDGGWLDGSRLFAQRPAVPPKRPPGRPKGSRDSQPRRGIQRTVTAPIPAGDEDAGVTMQHSEISGAEEPTHFPHAHPEPEQQPEPPATA
jgi:hypothetical protein